MADSTRDVLTGIRQQILAEGAKRLGLVIGIDRYRDSRLNLRYARADAEAMSRLMTDPECGLFAPEHVTLLCDEEATRDRIWRALATVRRKAGSGDMVWIYYAGHGALEDNDAYWIPHDGDVDDLFGTGISRRDLVRVLDEIRAKRVVVFLDCCHAAAMALRTDLARSVEAITAERAFAAYQGKGRVIVASSDGREKSVELEKVGRGAFTYFLEQGLRGEADAGRCGIVTLDTLWNFVNARVKAATRDAGHEQNPVLMGEITHGLPLTLNPLEWGRRKRLADGILARVGVGDRDLSTEEARVCLELLSMGARAEAEVAVLDAMEAFVTGTLSLAAFRHLVRATRLLPGGVAPIEVGTPAASDVAGPETHQETPVSPRTQNLMGEPATPPNVEIVKNLADILREFHFDEDAAKNILNAWSQRKKFVLAPICEHAKLERLTNGAVFIVTMQQLWEQRALTSVTRGVAFPPERQGWSFLATKPLDVRRIPEMNPQMISDIAQMCLDCGGSGIFLCSSCFGTGQAPCSFCDGVGHERISAGWYSTTKKCSFCKGTGLVPCRKCTRKEINTPCRSCNGTGLTCFKRTPEAIDSDIWKFHVDIPKDFTEQEIKVDGNYPLALNVCPSCKGTGVWNCPNCSGTGQAPCSFCDGVGHEHMGNGWYSRDKKCPICQGTGIRMCRRCHTNSSHKCHVCFGSGLAAAVPRRNTQRVRTDPSIDPIRKRFVGDTRRTGPICVHDVDLFLPVHYDGKFRFVRALNELFDTPVGGQNPNLPAGGIPSQKLPIVNPEPLRLVVGWDYLGFKLLPNLFPKHCERWLFAVKQVSQDRLPPRIGSIYVPRVYFRKHFFVFELVVLRENPRTKLSDNGTVYMPQRWRVRAAKRSLQLRANFVSPFEFS